MTPDDWPGFLRECFRVLRPGGFLCSTELETSTVSTSLSLTQYNALLMRAIRLKKKVFVPAGDTSGITAVQRRLLKDAGFVELQQQAFVIDYSADMSAHTDLYDNFKTLMLLTLPLAVRSGQASQEEIERLYARARGDGERRLLRYCLSASCIWEETLALPITLGRRVF